jgi:pyridinium-3,5-bisthiocarboxylic acid mononucleotide nickel chelatase
VKVAYFDCPAGASGDMILGALVDAGCPLAELEKALRMLDVSGWRLEAQPVERAGLRGTHLVVQTDPAAHFHDLAGLLAPIERSDLPETVKTRATRILRRLAEAESRVHRVPVEAVHFHEVGALDTLVDVVGAVAGLDALGVETVGVSAFPLGGGTVQTAHGRLPVPAPATTELLRGFPVYDNGVQSELVTPTGAAILTTLAASAGRMPAMTVESVGYGAGTMDLPGTPNILRCFLGQTAESAAADETVLQVETTIDDMSPQLYETLIERIFDAGALDVFLQPVIMKRGRPGVVVTALCAAERISDLSRALFEETTTIGVRWSEWRRARLQREMVEVTTAYGTIPFKVSRLAGRVVTVTPEFADVARIAREKSLPVREVLDQARADGRHLLGQ